MDQIDDGPDFVPPAKPNASVAKRDKRMHLMRTAQGKAAQPPGPKSHRRPKPSLPPTPWDKKPDVAD